MARKRTEVIDEDGNALPPPEPGSPVAAVIYLLEYGRLRGFRIGPTVQVDGVIVQVADLRQQMQMQKAQAEGSPDIEPGSDMALILGSEG